MPDIRQLQERVARAMPPAILDRRDGWWLRYTGSTQWWASSVLPHSDAPDLQAKIQEAEKFYAGHGMLPHFQITPGVCPPALDSVLADRGYQRSGPISLQTARVTDLLSDGEFSAESQPTDAWLATWLAVHGSDPSLERDMLRRVTHPSAYASVTAETRVIAVGRAVADTGWAGVFGMATLPEARGKGAARQILSALAQWSATQGAAHMYLQVECHNTAAMRLYERAGFTDLCRYHYRVGVPHQ